MNVQISDNHKILSAAALKRIAIASMLIDHSAKALLYNCVIKPQSPITKGTGLDTLYQVYQQLRNIGRIAFPIFCFFLVEGFLHTRNRWKYLTRLIIFGIVSEIPFDLGLYGKLWEPAHQNVMFELALGLVMLMLWEKIGQIEKLPPVVSMALQWASAAALMYAAYSFHFDYRHRGLALILILYLLRYDRVAQCTCGAVFISLWEMPAIFSFALLYLYNGERGRQNKYFFYAFYPAHLMILFVLTKLLSGTP